MKMKTVLAAALTAILGYGTNANAVIIDLFDDPKTSDVPNFQMVQDFTNGVGPVANQYGPATSIIGSYRDLVVDALSGASPPVTGSTLLVQNGSLQFSNTTSTPSGVNGVGVVQWDGDDAATPGTLNPTGFVDPNTGLGLDLINQEGCPVSGCDRFEAAVLFADAGFEYKIGVYTDATHYSILTADTLFPVASLYTADYLFSWFSLTPGNYFLGGLPFNIAWGSGGAANFNNVGAIQLTLNTAGTLAVDLTIDSITKTAPEPGVLALMGIGLLGAGLTGRRKTRKVS